MKTTKRAASRVRRRAARRAEPLETIGERPETNEVYERSREAEGEREELEEMERREEQMIYGSHWRGHHPRDSSILTANFAARIAHRITRMCKYLQRAILKLRLLMFAL